MSLKSFLECSVALGACALATSSADGAAFTVGISPGKFELTARPGEVIRDTVTLMNAGDEPGTYLFKTNDWQLNDKGGIEYLGDTIDDDSCRPWVRLERRSVEIVPGGEKNYRFEVHVPDDAPDGLCRFAIIVEPTDPYVVNTADGHVSMPILGRFAVLVYVTIGDAAADMSLQGLETTVVNGQRVPAIRLENTGNTYDRVFGQVTAIDASGMRHTLNASDFPILPGHTEAIALIPDASAAAGDESALPFPLRLEGRIEVGGERFSVEGTVD